MKRILSLLLALGLIASYATAQEVLTPIKLAPKDARSAAMGGAFNALASGYQSLYGNPAGFGVGRGMLTLANASVWGYVKPTEDNIKTLSNLGDISTMLGPISDLLTSNGIGAGAAAGLGFTGGGLGLGATMVTEEYARGNTLLGTNFTSATQVNFVAGLAITLGPKEFNVKLGGDLRPFVRIDGSFPVSDLLSSLSDGDPFAVIMAQPARYGVGLAADLGAIATLGPFAAGLSIRDIAPAFAYTLTDFQTATQGSVASDPNGDKAQFIPDISLGLSWSPRFIPGVIDPAVYFEVKDPLNAAKGNTVWNLLHVGGELRLLSFVYLRGGMSQGWLSAGAGINLLILQLDVAAFTEELGLHPGDKPRSGVAANVRLHL